MTSKERVRAAFAHTQPDKVPVDFGGFCCSMVNAICVKELREHYGLPYQPPRINDMSTMTAYVDPDLADAMGCDVQQLYNYGDTYGHINTDWKEWSYRGEPVLIPGNCIVKEDGAGGFYVYPQGDDSVAPSGHMPAGGYYFDNIERSPEFDEDEAYIEEQLESYPPVTDAQIAYHKKVYEETRGTNRAIQVGIGGSGLGDANDIPGANVKNPRGIRSISEWYMAPLLYPDYVHEVFEAQSDRAIENFKKYFEAFGNDIDVAFICGTDFGTQRGPFLDPKVFDEFYLPYYKKMNDWIHQNTTWKTLKHSCGGIFPILPGLIKAGFDAINPVQCSAEGMDPQALKDTFGKDIVFWGGGVDTQKILPFGTPQEVKDQVKERCEIFNKDGGFVFNTIHNIQANTPLDNIVAMVDALKEYNGDK